MRGIGKKLRKLVEECDEGADVEHAQPDGNDKPDSLREVNEELERQARWMEKKLKMVKDIS